MELRGGQAGESPGMPWGREKTGEGPGPETGGRGVMRGGMSTGFEREGESRRAMGIPFANRLGQGEGQRTEGKGDGPAGLFSERQSWIWTNGECRVQRRAVEGRVWLDFWRMVMVTRAVMVVLVGWMVAGCCATQAVKRVMGPMPAPISVDEQVRRLSEWRRQFSDLRATTMDRGVTLR